MDISPALQERLHTLELVAYWEGQITTSVLTRHFGISRQQASSDINRYCEYAPNNLIYNATAKARLIGANFTPLFITLDAAEYLNWASAGRLNIHSAPTAPPTLVLGLPVRQVEPTVMRGLVAAIRQQQRIEVDYVSLSNPNRQGRIIAPHHFVKTGLRWHLRAWCEKSQQYRDFVLSRFRGHPELLGSSAQTAEQDQGWNTHIDILLQPDPRLSKVKQQVLEQDYQMQNGQLRITTRACLAQYLLQEMQINTKMLHGLPEAQQLVLVNLPDIKDWLF